MGADPIRPVRIAIIDDHELLTASLAAALRAEDFHVIVADLTDPDLADRLAEAEADVALLDLDLGERGSGEVLLVPLVAAGCRVLVVSGTSDESVIGRCLDRGASGWVPKSAAFDLLLDRVLELANGRPVIEPAVRDRLLRAWRQSNQDAAASMGPFLRLSRRERAVLTALVDGQSVDRISKESYVSAATVRSQVRAILTKLGVNSQLEAVAMATRAGWRDDPDG